MLPEPIPTVCPECNETYMRVRGNKRFCTKQCASRYRDKRRPPGQRRRYERVCEFCKETFKSQSKEGKFCSNSCKSKNGWATGRLSANTTTIYQPGEAHPHWKGGALHSKLRQYGISATAYEEMLVAQGGGCAICGGNRTTRRLAVDHNHKTGEIRGLLCGSCNTGLGLFIDSPELLESAINYLARTGTQASPLAASS